MGSGIANEEFFLLLADKFIVVLMLFDVFSVDVSGHAKALLDFHSCSMKGTTSGLLLSGLDSHRLSNRPVVDVKCIPSLVQQSS